MGYDITVVTPVYNGASYLEECIESVKFQKGVSVEHVVVDDGSTDASYAIASKFKHIVLIGQDNLGAPSARNYGFFKSKGKYIKFLDADDLLLPGSLQKQFQAAEEVAKKGKIITYGYRDVYWEQRRFFKRKAYNVSLDAEAGDDSISRSIAERISKNIMTSLPLYPSKAVKEVGGFDARLRSSQEWNMNIRLAIAGYRFLFDNVHCYTQRVHGSSFRISNRKWNPDQELENDRHTYEEVKRFFDCLHVREAWANRLRKKASGFIREGFYEQGRVLFEESARLTDDASVHRNYSYPYRILVQALGEYGASKTYNNLTSSIKRIVYMK